MQGIDRLGGSLMTDARYWQPSSNLECVSRYDEKGRMPTGAVFVANRSYSACNPRDYPERQPACFVCLPAIRVRQGYVARPFQAAGQSGEAMRPLPLCVHRRH